MSIVAPHPETRVVLSNISWATYEALVADSDSPGKRLSMIGGPWKSCRLPKNTNGTTGCWAGWSSLHAGAEHSHSKHGCDDIEVANEGTRPGTGRILLYHERTAGAGLCGLGPGRDPPPDLAIEVEISSSAIDKLAIYGDLSVLEVWFYDGESLQMHVSNPTGPTKLRLAAPSCQN